MGLKASGWLRIFLAAPFFILAVAVTVAATVLDGPSLGALQTLLIVAWICGLAGLGVATLLGSRWFKWLWIGTLIAWTNLIALRTFQAAVFVMFPEEDKIVGQETLNRAMILCVLTSSLWIITAITLWRTGRKSQQDKPLE